MNQNTDDRLIPDPEKNILPTYVKQDYSTE